MSNVLPPQTAPRPLGAVDGPIDGPIDGPRHRVARSSGAKRVPRDPAPSHTDDGRREIVDSNSRATATARLTQKDNSDKDTLGNGGIANITSAGAEVTSPTESKSNSSDPGSLAAAGHAKTRASKKIPTWSEYLAARQVKFSLQVLTTVAIGYNIELTRPHFAKFIELQYVHPEGWALIGLDDAYFVSFYVVVLVLVRSIFMTHVLAPGAKFLGIRRRRAQVRFAEQGWSVAYYLTAWMAGVYLLYTSEYSNSVRALWTGWPHYQMRPFTKMYYLIQLACWLSQIYVLNIEEHRKDHIQMFTHHIVTVALVTGSYYYYFTRVGHVILVLMDGVDVIFSGAKMLKYLGFQTACDLAFGAFLIGWLVCRHGYYNYITWSAITEIGKIVEEKCYYTPDGELLRCFTSTVQGVFVTLLVILQIVTLIWLTMILRVVYKIIQGKPAEDNRSDDEDDDEDGNGN